ncbi:hypothetical protein NL676_037928 [Syzygium grande]|nr:hypothetical protein NL676_037928 [Syzygium grande]
MNSTGSDPARRKKKKKKKEHVRNPRDGGRGERRERGGRSGGDDDKRQKSARDSRLSSFRGAPNQSNDSPIIATDLSSSSPTFFVFVFVFVSATLASLASSFRTKAGARGGGTGRGFGGGQSPAPRFLLRAQACRSPRMRVIGGYHSFLPLGFASAARLFQLLLLHNAFRSFRCLGGVTRAGRRRC